MTDRAIRVVAAGWYDDPADPAKVRWWNGVTWTEHTEAKPGRGPGARTRTGAIWLVGLIPVIALVLSLGAAYVFLYVTSTPFVWLVGFAPYLLGILGAASDSRQLAARGLRAPSPVWALLTPIAYLIARRVRVPGNGPLLLVASTAVLAVLLPAVVWLSGVARPVALALEVQRTAVHELVDTGRLDAVSCPPFVESLAPGTLFTCDATGPDGLPTRVWVSIDSADGAFSLAPAV